MIYVDVLSAPQILLLKNTVIKANTFFDIEGNVKYFGSVLKNKYCIHEKKELT